MTKIFERIVKSVNDILALPGELNTLAWEYESKGYKVERGLLGVVILKLEDGEIHIVPGGNLIKEFGFKY